MRRIRQLFTENVPTKIMAIFFAGALWSYAYYFSLQSETAENVPLEIRVPDGWAVIERDPPALASVTFTYPTHAADRVKDALIRGEIRAVYVAEPGPDEALKSFEGVRLQPGDFHVPSGTDLRVDEWSPKIVNFKIAKKATRRLKVELDLSDPPAGYRMQGKPWWSPRTIEVQGPVEVLDKAKCIRTKPITISPPPQLGPPRQLSIPILPVVEVEGKAYSVTCSERIDYIIYLTPELTARVFEKVPLLVARPQDFPHVVKLKERQIDVTVRGGAAAVADLQRRNVRLFVDVSDLRPQATQQLTDVHAMIVGVANPDDFEIELKNSKVGVDVQPAVP